MVFLTFLKRVIGSFSTATYLLILYRAFSYSLTKLQNYSLSESLINSFEVIRSWKTVTTKLINKTLKKQHRYICWVSQWLGKIHGPWPILPPKVTANLKSCLQKYSVENKKQNQILPATIEKIIFFFPRKLPMVLLDKGLQWVNVNQRPFKHIQT